MGRWIVPWLVILVACSDPAAKPDAGVDAGAPDTVAAEVSITPSSFNYGELELGSTLKPLRMFEIQNLTPAALDLASIAIGGTNAADFDLDAAGCGPTLEGGAVCNVVVGFAPIARDMRSAQLDVMTATLATAFLQGTATVRTQRLIFEPPSRDFGDVAVGETSAQITFTVINEAVAGPITATISPAGTAFSIVSTDCAATTIPLHGSCSVVAQWTPAYSGRHAATLQLTAGSGTFGAGLTGNSSRPLGITPTSGAMGSMLVGQGAATVQRTFTIANNGTATTGALTTTFSGTDAAAYNVASSTCTTLAPTETCDIIVELDKATITTRGTKLAQLVVSDGTSTVVARAPLTGSAYTLLITGDEMFPSTTSGQQSAIQTFTILNASNVDTGTIATNLGSQFTIASNDCGPGIVAHASCSVGVRFTPTSTGAKTADLTLTATGAGGTDTMTLSGTGL